MSNNQPNPNLTGWWAKYGDFLQCPFCKVQLLYEKGRSLYCKQCKRPAWRVGKGRITRVDYRPGWTNLD